jgi:hypothetical protein
VKWSVVPSGTVSNCVQVYTLSKQPEVSPKSEEGNADPTTRLLDLLEIDHRLRRPTGMKRVLSEGHGKSSRAAGIPGHSAAELRLSFDPPLPFNLVTPSFAS